MAGIVGIVSQHVVNPVAQVLPEQNGVPTPGRRIQGTDEKPAFSIAISSDGWTMASGSSDGSITLRRWQRDEGRFRRYLRMRHHKDWVCWVAFSRDGTFLVSAGRDCLVNVFDVRDRDKPAIVRVLKTAQCATSACFSADGREVVAGCADNDVYVWKVDRSPAGPPRRLKGHTDHVLSVATSPCQVQIASGSRDQTVRLWDSSGRPGPVLTGHEDCVNSVAFSPDGETLASGSADGTVRLWNVAKKKPSCVYTVKDHSNAEVYTLCFSPCGHLLASASARNLILVLAEAAEDGPGVKKGIDKDAMRTAVFEPGSWAGGKGSKAWKTPRKLQRITDRELLVNSLGITPNREHLVASCRDGSVRMWNLRKQAGKNMVRLDRVLKDSHADVFAGTLGLNKNVLLREFRGSPELIKRLHAHYKSLARYPANPALQRVLESSLVSEGDVLSEGDILDVAFERPRTDAAQPATLQAFVATAAKSGGIQLKYKYYWTLQVAQAIAHLHYEHPGISETGQHGGISPRNVLMKSGKSEAVVAVLALLERPTYVPADQQRAELIDRPFRAPEVIGRDAAAANKLADVWSFGALVHYIWTDGLVPYGDGGPVEATVSTFEGGHRTGMAERAVAPAVNDVIRRCLSVDPSKRPSMFKVVDMVASIVKGWQTTVDRPSLGSSGSLTSGRTSRLGRPTTRTPTDRFFQSSSGSGDVLRRSSNSSGTSKLSAPSPVLGLLGEDGLGQQQDSARESMGSGPGVSRGVPSEPIGDGPPARPDGGGDNTPESPRDYWTAYAGTSGTPGGARTGNWLSDLQNSPGGSPEVEHVPWWSPPAPSPPRPLVLSPPSAYAPFAVAGLLSPHSNDGQPELDQQDFEYPAVSVAGPFSPHSDWQPELDQQVVEHPAVSVAGPFSPHSNAQSELDLQDDTPLLELIAESCSAPDPSDWAEDAKKCKTQQLYTVGDLLVFARRLGSTERLRDQLKRLGVHPHATRKLCEYIEKLQPWRT